MKEQLLQTAKPILFNTEMVKAILDGRKTQTRRVVGDVGISEYFNVYTTHRKKGKHVQQAVFMCVGQPIYINYKYEIGDILYVRETFKIDALSNLDKRLTISFKTGDKLKLNEKDHNQVFEKFDRRLNGKWKPSIHMPKEYSRIFLKVTNVRVERLQDITRKDVLSEGIREHAVNQFHPHTCLFKAFWNSTAKDGYKWEDNPYVFVYEFEKVEVC